MAFATQCGLDIFESDINTLFNEELGCVIQVRNNNKVAVETALAQAGLAKYTPTDCHFNLTIYPLFSQNGNFWALG
jgi:phosphoribosylformylglycinamidine synthase